MTSEQFEKKLEKNMTNLTEKQKDYLRDIFKANNDQKETNHESLTVENMQTGIGFWGLLAIVLIVLKLCGVIKWGWWLVLLPLYGGLVLALLLIGIITFIAGWSALKK